MHYHTIAIIYGGDSPEHDESVKAARLLHEHAIRRLPSRGYRFVYFYISRDGRWASRKDSRRMLKKDVHPLQIDVDRVRHLCKVDVVYNTMMGTAGESGDVMGLASLLSIPMIGCGLETSCVCANKWVSRLIAQSVGVPVLDSVLLSIHDRLTTVASMASAIDVPCVVKPTNLGTCRHVFFADTMESLMRKWMITVRANHQSKWYIAQPKVTHVEVRVFAYEDEHRQLHLDDEHVTTLRDRVLVTGGVLFNTWPNTLDNDIRAEIARYTRALYRAFGVSDYARFDFFVTSQRHVYFNEVNTQPFIGTHGMRQLGMPFRDWFAAMIRKNTG